MDSRDFTLFSLQLTAMLMVALAFGQLMRRLRQPAVVGEMCGGIVLGPTILGVVAPAVYGWLFLSSSDAALAREASTKLGMLFFLFLAGLEMDVSVLGRLGRRVAGIGLIGTVLPIVAGAALVYALPRDFWGPVPQRHFAAFALFVGMNFANSANPVIARILMDLGMLATPIGTLIMSATLVDDFVNWTLFAIILSDITTAGHSIGETLLVSGGSVAAFCALFLCVSRWCGPVLLRRARAGLSWPGGFVAVTSLLILLAGSAAEALGIHAFLGAFLLGAGLGGRLEDADDARSTMRQFVMSFFAPLYFVSMGMTTDFVKNFDVAMIALVLLAACATKIGAVLLGAKAARMPLDREAWAIGFGLNARGATGIILAGVGLSAGLIDDRIFVAMVIMAIVTSMVSGPMMRYLLSDRKAHMGRLAPVTE